jgi:hypothetical protein
MVLVPLVCRESRSSAAKRMKAWPSELKGRTKLVSCEEISEWVCLAWYAEMKGEMEGDIKRECLLRGSHQHHLVTIDRRNNSNHRRTRKKKRVKVEHTLFREMASFKLA